MPTLLEETPTEEDFRKVGMTYGAVEFPRSEAQIVMFAAWLGTTPEAMPIGSRYFANATTKAAWERAETALLAYHGKV